MQYRLLEQGLLPVTGRLAPEEPFMEILSQEDYEKKYKHLVNDHLLIRSMRNLTHCKVDIFKDYILGTLRIPDKKDLENKDWSCGFYMDRQKLIFVGHVKEVEETIHKMGKNHIVTLTTPARMLFEFLECLVFDDMDFIDDYEESLDAKENEMNEDVNEIPKDFDRYISKTRKELMVLNRYYRQMAELGKALEDCPNDVLESDEKDLYRFFSDMMDRLYADVQGLKEYSLQIREMYQSRIDVRQNKVIQFLTIITTIFMPLTLITGWYGMNFTGMPELQWIYGYGIVILLALGIIVLEVVVFKKKKWL